MRTLQEIFDALSKAENGGDMVASLQEHLSKTRDEAASNRVARNKVLDALGLRDGDDLEGNLKSLVSTLSAVKKVGDPNSLGNQMATLQQQVKDLSDKYEASEAKVKEEKEKRITTSIKTALMQALSKGQALSPESMATLPELVNAIHVGEDDSLSFGDKKISIDDGVKEWLSSHEWAVKNTSETGAGTGAPQGARKVYGLDELKSMSREEINAHWDEISKGDLKND